MGKRHTILVVDDNVATRTLIEHTLELDGYQVVGLADGENVLGVIESVNPDVVVLDVMMPRIDGFSVLNSIRSDERTKYLPVVMLTALDDADSTWKGWSGGCNYYMNKPFDPEHLLSTVASMITGASV